MSLVRNAKGQPKEPGGRDCPRRLGCPPPQLPPPLPQCQQGVLLMPHNNDDNDNNNDDKDDLVRFANNASLALSSLCGRVSGPTSTAAAAAAEAANASSLGKGIKQQAKKLQQRGQHKCDGGCQRTAATRQRKQAMAAAAATVVAAKAKVVSDG